MIVDFSLRCKIYSPSISNETFKNAVIIPRGGSFRSAGAIERYKDKEGNIIHVHPVEHRQ
jgi:hypothetical protein